MDKQIDKLINHIRDLENRLGEVDNNLQKTEQTVTAKTAMLLQF